MINLVKRSSNLIEEFYVKIIFWILNSKLLFGRTWYQYVQFRKITTRRYCGKKGVERTESFLSWLKQDNLLRSDDVVLDLGSNAGYLAIKMVSKVKRVYAIEIDSKFHRQAQFLRRIMLKGENRSNLELIHGDIFDQIGLLENVSVLVASKFFYHPNFSTDIEKFMYAVNRSKIRLIVIQGHIVWGELGNESGIHNLLEKHGFKYLSGIAGTNEYPIGIAKRY